MEDESHIFIRSVPICDIGFPSTIMTNINVLRTLRLNYRKEEKSARTPTAILKILLTREDFPTPLCKYERQSSLSAIYQAPTKIPTFPMTTIRNLCDQGKGLKKDRVKIDWMRRTVGMQQGFLQRSIANRWRSRSWRVRRWPFRWAHAKGEKPTIR